ncbi:MAG: helix-turn-helix domain-containing protein, partial [Mycobacteriales bacterium]
MAALRHGRRVARLSQRDLARRAGVSQSLIARIEARRVDPPVGEMQRLLGLCGLRWELQLVAGGATAAERRSRSALVRQRARRRGDAGVFRRMAEN